MRRVARISVVVPIYNVEPFLDECLRSIAGQTFADLEVVMVDDGSTDGSAAIAERFAAADGRFRLISQPNAGLGAARNTGLDAATGEHLAFVDSDDVLPPGGYARLLGALDRTACNKLWRRAFWDELGLRFPEGRLHEDIALVLRAHFAARAVDVVAAPVYHYRRREEGEPSI